jgi:DNA-binding LytR/AlgR family response regulator
VKLLEAENGMQIHRSHWVSLDHVDEVLARGGRMICRMTAGPDLPVSRNYRPALKAARRQKASIPQ